MGIPAARGLTAAGLPNLGDQANAVLSGLFTGVGPSSPFAFRGPMNLSIWASIVTALTTTAGSLAATVGSGASLAPGSAISSINAPKGATVATIAGTNITIALPPHTYMGVITGANLNPATISGLVQTDRLLGAIVTVPSNAEGVTLPAGTTVTAILRAAVLPSLYSPGVPGIVQLSAAPTATPSNNFQIPFQFALAPAAITISGADAAASFTGSSVDYVGTIQLERSFDGGATWLVCNLGNSGSLAEWDNGSPINITFGEPEKNVLYRLNCTAYISGNINYRISETGGAAESLAIGPLSSG